MKYLRIKNRITDTAPDMTGEMNQDETVTTEQQQNSHKYRHGISNCHYINSDEFGNFSSEIRNTKQVLMPGFGYISWAGNSE